MLQHGAKVNTRYLALNALAKPGDTGPLPLEAAIRGKHPDTVKLLLGAGADPALEGQQKKTMLQIAEEQGEVKIIEIIKTAVKK